MSCAVADPNLQLLRDRTVIGCLGIACLLNCSWYLQGDYLCEGGRTITAHRSAC